MKILIFNGLSKSGNFARTQDDFGKRLFQLQSAERAVKFTAAAVGNALQIALIEAADDPVALVVFEVDRPVLLIADRYRRAVARTDADGMNFYALLFHLSDRGIEFVAVVFAVREQNENLF